MSIINKEKEKSEMKQARLKKEKKEGKKMRRTFTVIVILFVILSCTAAAESTCTTHVPGERQNVIEATCIQKGYTGDVYCVNCNQLIEKGKETKKTEHKLVLENYVPATCIRYGYSGDGYCSVCGEKFWGSKTGLVDHQFDENNTCTICGWKEPGFYMDDELIMNWKELKENGYVQVGVIEKWKGLEVTKLQGNLNGLLVLGEEITYVDGNHYQFANEYLKALWIPRSVTGFGEYILNSSPNVTEVRIFCPVSELGGFNNSYGRSSLESINIPETVITIGREAFSNHPNLKQIFIPDSVRYIEYGAFTGTGIEELVVPEGVETFGEMRSNALKSITLPGSLTEIEEMAFQYCGSLEYVDMSACDQIQYLPYGLFRDCASLKTVLLPPHLKSFDGRYRTFDSYGGTKSIPIELLDLPEGFSNLGREDFVCLLDLKTIVWPVSLIQAPRYHDSITEIRYRGTEGQWKMTEAYAKWDLSNVKVIFNYKDE